MVGLLYLKQGLSPFDILLCGGGWSIVRIIRSFASENWLESHSPFQWTLRLLVLDFSVHCVAMRESQQLLQFCLFSLCNDPCCDSLMTTFYLNGLLQRIIILAGITRLFVAALHFWFSGNSEDTKRIWLSIILVLHVCYHVHSNTFACLAVGLHFLWNIFCA